MGEATAAAGQPARLPPPKQVMFLLISRADRDATVGRGAACGVQRVMTELRCETTTGEGAREGGREEGEWAGQGKGRKRN